MSDEDPFHDLEERLSAAKKTLTEKDGPERAKNVSSGGLSLGIHISVDLISGVAVGTGLGIFLDFLLGTDPVLMTIFLLMGGAAGMLNAWHTAHPPEDHKEQR